MLKIVIPAALIGAAAMLILIVWWDASRHVDVVVTGDANATITVHIDGAVVHPGVVTLPAGARLDEAISAAGGLAPDADVSRLFLAARVGDGERITIPRQERASDSTAGTPEQSEAGVGRLNLNTATVAQLEELPGVGKVLAERIVSYRDAHGPFTSVDQLTNVEGIGPSLLEKLRPLVTVGD
ncbi:MAG: helix-hairpin-helix domain-containing protein [Thermomicrobiales bacterium]